MVNPVEPAATGGDRQVLVAELDPTGANLLFSTIIGSDGLDTENPAGLAVDSAGDIYLAGNTIGPDLITTPGAFQTTNPKGGCCWAGFVAKILPAEVSLSPTRLTFGPQDVGTTSARQTVTLTINGEGTFRVSSITASGDFGVGNTCGYSSAHSSCTITVTFTPTTTGPRSGLITIIDYASGGRQTVTLSGTGVRVMRLPPIGHPIGPMSQPAPLQPKL